MIDLTQPPKNVAIALINDANGTSYTPSTISLGTPTDNTFVVNGLNTYITVTALGGNQSLPTAVQYNRLSFKTLLERPYCQLADSNPSRLVDLIPLLNEKYALGLTNSDIVDGPFRPDDVSTGIKKITVSVQPNHYVYTGSATVYIGDPALIADWFAKSQFQVAADFNTLNFTGGTYRFGDRTLTGISQTYAQRSGVVALYLLPNGTLRPSATYQKNTKNPLIARFKNNRLCEVVGLRGETSYDEDGKLLAKVPVLPTRIADIPETLGFTAALNNGVLSYSLTFDVESKKAGAGTVYYVDVKNGNDTNSGASELLAFKSFRRALNVLPAARVIRVKGYSDAVYDADSGWTQTVRDRTLDVIGYGDTAPVFTSTRVVGEWTNQTDNVWFTTASDAAAVVDKTVTSISAGYGRMTAAVSVEACRTTAHSYFIDGTANRVYVHTTDNRKPDANVQVIVKTLCGSVADKSQVYLQNLKFDLSYNGFVADMTVPKTYGYLYLKGCTFGWTAKDAALNSYGYNVINQDGKGQFGFTGGFKYNSDRILPTMGTKFWVVENACLVNYCGFDGLHTSSASALGAQGTALRINCQYASCDGHHVQDSGEGTFSLNVGCSSATVKNTLNNLSHYITGANSLVAVEAQFWSCTHDNSAYSYTPKGAGSVALFDSDIGAKPAISVVSPYRFLYTA